MGSGDQELYGTLLTIVDDDGNYIRAVVLTYGLADVVEGDHVTLYGVAVDTIRWWVNREDERENVITESPFFFAAFYDIIEIIED